MQHCKQRLSRMVPVTGVLVALVAALIQYKPANADYLWAGREQLFGKVISIDNNRVSFQVNCKGEPRIFNWRKGAFSVVFGEGCKDFNIPAWGEPVNCKGRGRLFIGGGPRHQVHYADQVTFQNDELMMGAKGKQLPVKDYRRHNFGIWMGCS